MFLSEVLENEAYKEIKGFEKLTESSEMFKQFLRNFYNKWGIDTRATIQPKTVKFVKDKAGAYLRFDYIIDGREEWVHVKGADRYY